MPSRSHRDSASGSRGPGRNLMERPGPAAPPPAAGRLPAGFQPGLWAAAVTEAECPGT